MAERQGVETVLLTASDMGKPIYERLVLRPTSIMFFSSNDTVCVDYNNLCIKNWKTGFR
jgi:hypothetical protein